MEKQSYRSGEGFAIIEMKKRKGKINFQRKKKYPGTGNRLRRLPEERWLKGWRMDLEKVILWPARGFTFL